MSHCYLSLVLFQVLNQNERPNDVAQQRSQWFSKVQIKFDAFALLKGLTSIVVLVKFFEHKQDGDVAQR